MAAIMNGIALHGGYLPFGGTFLTFSDYSRNALRMAALMKQRVVHVFTHDSIGLGEDGPTHQSVEHAASLRLIPNLHVWRPCDTTETAAAWTCAVRRPASMGMDVKDGGPSALLLSRQNLPFVARDAQTIAAISRGGYVLRDAADARAIIIATGSEVGLALDAQEQLAAKGVAVARGVHALHQCFRCAGCAVARIRAAQGPAARGGRGRRDCRLAQIRWIGWRCRGSSTPTANRLRRGHCSSFLA